MFVVRLEEVLIPDYMLPPVPHKVKGAINHINKGSLWPLKLEHTEQGWLLRDGYARYLAALQSGLIEIPAEIWTPEHSKVV
jgi:hypothetical protein